MPRFSFCALVVASPLVAVFADVPLGVCHQCEVTCFSDCANKFDEEIIQAERREYEAKQRMLRLHGSEHLAARGLAGVRLDPVLLQTDPVDEAQKSPKHNRTGHVFAWRTARPEAEQEKIAQEQLIAHGDRFAKCLEMNKCPSHSETPGSPQCAQFAEQPASLLALRGSKNPGNLPGSQCAMRCANEIAMDDMKQAEKPSLLQRGAPFPNYPVRRGMFKKGTLTLDFCLKSCLAVTCGCSGAPGFDALDKLFQQVKNNIKAQMPVLDTNPKWQYHPATLAECAKGHPGKKVSKKLFIYTGGEYGDGGWVEICTIDLISAIFGPAYPETKQIMDKCESRKADDADFGCQWNKEQNKCLVGFVPVTVECQVRGKRDLVPGTEFAKPLETGKLLDKANDMMDSYAANGDDMSFD